MIKVASITPSAKNAEWDVVRFENVLTELETVGGTKIRSTGKAFLKANHTFEVGMTFKGVTILSVAHETAQYEGHEPYDVNGKYYTNEIVEKTTA